MVNLTTGVSGAGRTTSLGLHFGEVNENAKPYKVGGNHRHTAEIELNLGRVATQGKQVKTHSLPATPTISFNPQLVPMTRGILAVAYARPTHHADWTGERLLELYKSFYQVTP